jgi:SAM-dependent methyltransferase
METQAAYPPVTHRDRILFFWGQMHIGETIRRRAVIRVVRSLSFSEGTILDVGCGRGDIAIMVSRRFPAARVIAIDLNPERAVLVQQRIEDGGVVNCSAEVGDIRNGIGEGHAIVYSVDVFEHLKDPASALASCARAVLVGGFVIIHVPRATQRRWFRRFDHYDQHDHERDGFEPEELDVMMRGCGLTPLRTVHTFGPPGALAWELFHMSQSVGKWLALVTYPVTWILAQIDHWIPWRRGNGVLILAQRI